jgi:hypothetical protein
MCSLHLLNRPLCSKENKSPPWKLWYDGSIVFKFYVNLTGIKGARCSRFYQRWHSSDRYMCFQLFWTGLFRAHQSYTHLETCKLQEVILEQQTQFSQGKNVLGPFASKKLVFFQEIHVFLQHSWIGLLEASRAYLQIENRDLLKVFLLKANWVLTVKQCSRSSLY